MSRATRILFSVMLGLSFLLLVGGLFRMQIIEGHIYQAEAEGNRIRLLTVKAPRGVIYDRNGKQLVSNQPSFSVAVTAADLPEGAEAQAAVFEALASLLHTLPVWTVEPDKLFDPRDPAQAARVIHEMAPMVGIGEAELTEQLTSANKISPETPSLLRSDLTPAEVAQITAHAKDWPGVQVMNELQFNFITRQDRPYSPVTIKRNIPFETMQRIEEEHLNLPGVSVVSEPLRQYALGSYMSHILGYVGPIPPDQYNESLPPEGSGDPPPYDKDDKVGLLGIEARMEDVLRGRKGVRQIEVNVNQREVREINSTPPLPGENVALTIDSALQMTVTRLLQDGINEAHAQGVSKNGAVIGGGVAVVQKVSTGEILALVSLPSYDNNLFASGITQDEFDRLNQDPNLPMFHRAVNGAYPPGSTLKLITAAAGLQSGVITPNTVIFDPGHIDVPLTYDEATRNIYKCWKTDGHGPLNVYEALQESCDVFFYEVAGPGQLDARGQITHFYMPGQPKSQNFAGMGIDKLNYYMEQFGMGTPTGIDLPGEVKGRAPNPAWKSNAFPGNEWSLGDTLVAAIGQGFDLATPLQISNMTAAVANGGKLYQPQVVYQILNSDGGTVVQDFQPRLIRQIAIDPQNLAVVRQGMRMAVNDVSAKATAHRTNLVGVHVAGKTGTAEIGEVIDDKGHRRAHAWFTGFAPYEQPDIAVTVLIEAGGESLEGSTFAVPVAQKIFQAYFHLNEPDPK
jgi:penicillin-binding protein 2